MASLDGPFSIDLVRYWSLPHDVRVRFDEWLVSEQLADKAGVKLRLDDEGRVVVDCYEMDDARDPRVPGARPAST